MYDEATGGKLSIEVGRMITYTVPGEARLRTLQRDYCIPEEEADSGCHDLCKVAD